MLKRTERISFRISSVLSKVEPELEQEPDLHTGSDQKVPAPAPQHCSGSKLDPYLLCSFGHRDPYFE